MGAEVSPRHSWNVPALANAGNAKEGVRSYNNGKGQRMSDKCPKCGNVYAGSTGAMICPECNDNITLRAENERLKVACKKEFESVQKLDSENQRLRALLAEALPALQKANL